MRKIFLVAAMAAILVSCGGSGKYSISGNIEGLTGRILIEDGNDGTTIARTESRMGEFSLEGEVSEPQLVMFSAPESNMNTIMVLEEGDITISIDPQSGLISVAGTPLNEKLTASSKLMLELTQDPEITTDDIIGFLLDNTRKNQDNALGIFFFLNVYSALSDQEVEAVYSQLSESNQQDPGVAKIMYDLRQSKKTQVGQPFIPITMAQENGEQVALADVVAQNKYTLIDFWASWCRPCMAEVPNLIEAYNKYHSKGFEVYAISVDRDVESWVEACTYFEMNWINVSHLVDGNRTALEDYVVSTIPANFLIDQSGTIVARDLRGSELDAKLEELLK